MDLRSDQYKVVVNQERQYAIIPIDQALKLGYREAGVKGPKEVCLTYIEEVWTDMRLSDRERILRSLGG